jgi:hypothetical protein
MIGVQEYDDYFQCSLIARDYMGSHRFRGTQLLGGALCMEHLVIPMRTTYAWQSPHALKL